MEPIIVLVGAGGGVVATAKSLLRARITKFSMIANSIETERRREPPYDPIGLGLFKDLIRGIGWDDVAKQLLNTTLTPVNDWKGLRLSLNEQVGELKRIHIVLEGLAQLKGDYQLAVDEINESLRNPFRVLPCVLQHTQQEVLLDGNWMNNFAFAYRQDQTQVPEGMRLNPSVELNPTVVNLLKSATHIFMGPGTVYYSLWPQLLAGGFFEALEETDAKITLIANTQAGIPDGHIATMSDFLGIWSALLPEQEVTVLAHNAEIVGDDALVDDLSRASRYGYFEIVRKEICQAESPYHDEERLGAVLAEIIRG